MVVGQMLEKMDISRFHCAYGLLERDTFFGLFMYIFCYCEFGFCEWFGSALMGEGRLNW